MSSESSSAVALRAMVMLACLVAIPAAAMFGTSLPEVVKQLLQRHLGRTSAAAAASLASAPPFVPAASAATTTWSPSAVPPAVTPAAPQQPCGRTFAAISPQAERLLQTGDGGIAVPASFEVAAAGGAEPGLLAPNLHETGMLVPVSAPPPPAVTDQAFAGTQQRLKALGATYSLLESWGSQGQLYRFYARVAIAGNPHYTRYFEATAADPVAAMRKVLEQVESWQASRP